VWEKELEVAIESLRKAAQLCENVQAERSQKTVQKGDRTPVTVADFGTQAIVCKIIKQHFPDDAIVAEEGAEQLQQSDNEPVLHAVTDQVQRCLGKATAKDVCEWIDLGNAEPNATRFWTLDPIDGTKGYLRGGQYALSLALLVDYELQLGVLCCPRLALTNFAATPPGTLLWARRGAGTYAAPLADVSQAKRVTVSSVGSVSEARFCESFESGHTSHDTCAKVRDLLQVTAEPHRIDSQAKYGLVAAGEAEAYFRLPPNPDYREKIWDHAAGCIVVTEAGGTVTDLTGKQLEFCHGKTLQSNTGVLATNGLLHNEILAAFKNLTPDP